MAETDKIDYLKISARELLSQIRKLRPVPENDQEQELNNRLLNLARQIFYHFKNYDPIDTTNPKGIADKLEEFLGKEELEKPIEKILEVEVVEVAEKELGSKALNSQDLKLLLEEYDRNRGEKAEKIADKFLKSHPGADRNMVMELIRRKTELEIKILKEVGDPVRADELSDRTLEVEQTVKLITAEKDLPPEKIEEIAQKIVKVAETAANPKEVLTQIKKEQVIKLGGEIEEQLIISAEEKRAEIVIDKKIEELTERVVRALEEKGIALKPEKRAEVAALVKERIVAVVDNPIETEIDAPKVKVILDSNGRLVDKVEVEPVTIRIAKIISEGTPVRLTNAQADEVVTAVNAAGKEAAELWEANGGDAAGKEIGDARKAILAKGASIKKTKEMLALRFGEEAAAPLSEKTIVKVQVEAPPGVIEDEPIKVRQELKETKAEKPTVRQEKTAVKQEIYITQQAKVVLEEFEAAKIVAANGHTRNIKQSVEEASVLSRFITGKTPINKVFKGLKEDRKIFGEVKALKPLYRVMDKVEASPFGVKSLEMVRQLTQWRERIDKLTGGWMSRITGGTFVQVGKIFGETAIGKGLQSFGIQTAYRFGGQTVGAMATQIAAHGFEKALPAILQQLFTKGTVSVATSAAGAATAGGAVATGAAVAAGPPGWVVAAVMVAAQVAIEIGKKIWGVAEKGLGKLLEFTGFGSAKTIQQVKDAIAKPINFLGKAVMTVGATILAIGGFISQIPTMGIGATVASVFIGLFLIGIMVASQIATLVPPKSYDAGGVCILKSDIDGKTNTSGDANCNPNAPSSNYPGLNKDAFVNLAERWSSGGGRNAAKCFNDVVCQALNAGINPIYALWAWLHESGASNYSLGDVEDFGIHGQADAPPRNFQKQIAKFLTLDPGSACPNLEYWLSFATNYLTGGCDPNKDISGTTGYSYLEEMKETWSWVSSSPMPPSIHIPKQSCGGGGVDPGDTQIGPDGKEYVCYGGGTVVPGTGGRHGTGAPTGPVSPQPTRDPNITIPPGCPSGWPVSGHWQVTQGPGGVYTHSAIEAIDIMESGGGIRGTPVKVTHPGVVTYAGYAGPIYGNLVIVQGTCQGRVFATYYAHLMSIELSTNTPLKPGQTIGHADNSGNYPAGNDHIHYELRGCEPDGSGCYDLHAFNISNFLPVDVPRGCFWDTCRVNGNLIYTD